MGALRQAVLDVLVARLRIVFGGLLEGEQAWRGSGLGLVLRLRVRVRVTVRVRVRDGIGLGLGLRRAVLITDSPHTSTY